MDDRRLNPVDEKNKDESFYVVYVPRDPRTTSPRAAEFLLSLPLKKADIEETKKFYAQLENCTEDKIKVVKLNMSPDEFKKRRGPGTYIDEKPFNALLQENEKLKIKNPKSLKKLTAEYLTKHPSLFQAQRVPQEAKEAFDKAKAKSIEKSGKQEAEEVSEPKKNIKK